MVTLPDERTLLDPEELYELVIPNATFTLCWAAAIALVYVGEGYGAYEVDGRGDNLTCFCGDIYNESYTNCINCESFFK